MPTEFQHCCCRQPDCSTDWQCQPCNRERGAQYVNKALLFIQKRMSVGVAPILATSEVSVPKTSRPVTAPAVPSAGILLTRFRHVSTIFTFTCVRKGTSVQTATPGCVHDQVRKSACQRQRAIARGGRQTRFLGYTAMSCTVQTLRRFAVVYGACDGRLRSAGLRSCRQTKSMGYHTPGHKGTAVCKSDSRYKAFGAGHLTRLLSTLLHSCSTAPACQTRCRICTPSSATC